MPLLDPNAPSPPSPFLPENAPGGTSTILVGPNGPSSPPTDSPENPGGEHSPGDHFSQGISEIGHGLQTMNTDLGDGFQEVVNGAGNIAEGIVEGIEDMFGSD